MGCRNNRGLFVRLGTPATGEAAAQAGVNQPERNLHTFDSGSFKPAHGSTHLEEITGKRGLGHPVMSTGVIKPGRRVAEKDFHSVIPTLITPRGRGGLQK